MTVFTMFFPPPALSLCQMLLSATQRGLPCRRKAFSVPCRIILGRKIKIFVIQAKKIRYFLAYMKNFSYLCIMKIHRVFGEKQVLLTT